MQECLARLKAVGVKPYDAYKIYDSFMRNFGVRELNEFINDLEKEHINEQLLSATDD